MPKGKTYADQALASEGSSKVLFRARGGKAQDGGGGARVELVILRVLALGSVGVIPGEVGASTKVDEDVGEGGKSEVTVLTVVLLPMLSGKTVGLALSVIELEGETGSSD